MAGSTIVVWGTPKTLEANGIGAGHLATGVANDADYSIVADGGNYPDAEFVLSVTFGSAPAAGASMLLFAQPLNIDGTNDAETNPASGVDVFVGAFIVNNVTSTQHMRCTGVDLPKEATYRVYNQSGVTMPSGWTLRVTPKSYGVD